MTLKSKLFMSLAVLLATGPAQAEEAPIPPPAPPMPPKQILLENSVKLNSGKFDTKVFRIAFPKGFKTPQHVHEGPGPRYVVKGRVRIEEGGQVNEYGPGQVFWESGAVMTAENVSDGEAELIIFEVIPHKEPEASSIKEGN
ncbi:MAG: cupin domain-containing protein [Methylococcaceae bacterium]|jgi:quercetin dioxygenase-like cupin family protein|nr:cupin domain-containing protein [Methylococcaceae bacterium]